MRIFLLTLLCLPLALAAQNRPLYSSVLLPAALLENANAVIRDRSVQFEVKSPGDASFREFRAVTLLNDKSHYDMLVVHYNSFNKLGKVKGKIYDAAGKLVREVEKNEIRHVSAISDFSTYEDDHFMYVDVEYSTYPFTVEFEYDLNFTDLMTYPQWDIADFGTAVQASQFSIKLADGLDVTTKQLNISVIPQVSTEKGWRKLAWRVENLPAVKSEPYGPPSSEILPAMLLSPHSFEVAKYRGSMASWKEYGDFMSLLMKGRDELSPTMKAKVAEITTNAHTDPEKIKALYRFVQETMRYVNISLGIGGWQPFDAKYVENNKFGDCKALSNFMMALLKEVGIPSYPVLIYSGDPNYEVTEDFTLPRFNHMILYVPAYDTWLDCTQSYAPVNYLGSHLADRNVMFVTEQGGKLSHTPPLLPEANLENNRVTIDLLPTGEATIDVKSMRTGDRQDWYRVATKELSKEDFEKKFQEYSPLRSFTLEKMDVSVEKDRPEATVAYRAKVPRYASKAGKRLFIPINQINQYNEVPPANDDRKIPVFVREGYVEVDTMTMALPSGYAVESMPSGDFKLESRFGKFSIKVAQENGVVKMVRRLETLPVRLPAAEYGEWRDFFKEVAKADATKLVLVEQG